MHLQKNLVIVKIILLEMQDWPSESIICFKRIRICHYSTKISLDLASKLRPHLVSSHQSRDLILLQKILLVDEPPEPALSLSIFIEQVNAIIIHFAAVYYVVKILTEPHAFSVLEAFGRSQQVLKMATSASVVDVLEATEVAFQGKERVFGGILF